MAASWNSPDDDKLEDLIGDLFAQIRADPEWLAANPPTGPSIHEIAAQGKEPEHLKEAEQLQQEDAHDDMDGFPSSMFVGEVPDKTMTVTLAGTKASIHCISPEFQHMFQGEGQVVWPSALSLAAWASTQPELFRNKRVLELGSGTGLCGIAVFRCLGARSVLLTDHDKDVLELLARNAKLVLAESVAAAGGAGVTSAPTDGTVQETAPVDAKYEVLDCAGVEWGRGGEQPSSGLTACTIPDSGYDVIVATDVVYGDGEFVLPLMETAFDKLSAGGTCYLANHSIRFDVLERQVLDAAGAVGFEITRMPALPSLKELAASGAVQSESDDNIDLEKLSEYLEVESGKRAGEDLGPVKFFVLHKP